MTPEGLPIAVVDAFTSRPFAGNPAAVCLLASPLGPHEDWMRRVAAEMNLAETAFLAASPGGGFDLRWFTPTVEVDLCGHATLASAHWLWEEGVLALATPARFHTKSGKLSAHRLDAGWIEVDFPATPATAVAAPASLAVALGLEPSWVGQSRFDFLVEVESEAEVRGLRPDLAGLRALGGRGVIVTARAADPRCDFVSRFFAPAAGVDEDPVTGSAHCALTPYWAERLGKSELSAHQASKRGGDLRLRRVGDRVRIGGQAVTVWRGHLVGDASGR